MDGSSPEGTPIHIMEVPIHIMEVPGQGSDVILLQAEQSAEAGASSQSPIPDHSQDPQSRAVTLQLPVQSPIHRPDSTLKTLSLDGKRFSIVTSPGTSRSGSEDSLTDSAHRGEFLRPSKKQVIPE